MTIDEKPRATFAVLVLTCGLLASPPAALASDPGAPPARQTTQREAEPQGAPDVSPGRFVEDAIRSLLDTLDQLFRGPSAPHEPRGGKGDQGASIDPSGHRMSKE
jgi:hypothetical protein